MDSVTAINTIRDSLRTNLIDPHSYYNSNVNRTWVYSDEPISGAQFPQVQLLKIDNPSRPISIGSNYWEQEELFLNIWFSSKNGFKATISGTEYKNAQLVEYYLGNIKSTLKDQFNTLHDAGVGSYYHVNTTPVEYDSETQLYFGAVTIRVRYFNQ